MGPTRFMIVRCLLRETCPVSSPVSRRKSWATVPIKAAMGQNNRFWQLSAQCCHGRVFGPLLPTGRHLGGYFSRYDGDFLATKAGNSGLGNLRSLSTLHN